MLPDAGASRESGRHPVGRVSLPVRVCNFRHGEVREGRILLCVTQPRATDGQGDPSYGLQSSVSSNCGNACIKCSFASIDALVLLRLRLVKFFKWLRVFNPSSVNVDPLSMIEVSEFN